MLESKNSSTDTATGGIRELMTQTKCGLLATADQNGCIIQLNFDKKWSGDLGVL